MKTNRLLNYGLAFSLSLGSLIPAYSQEKFKPYEDGNPVMMIHEEIADTTKVEDTTLRNFMIKRGGTNSIVHTPKTITQKDTLYIKEKSQRLLQPLNPTSSLESRAQETHWYNKNMFGINGLTAKRAFCASLALTSIYFISDSVSKHNDKHHTHDECYDDEELPEQPSGEIIDYPQSGENR